MTEMTNVAVEEVKVDVEAVLANEEATYMEVIEAKQTLIKEMEADLSRASKGQHAARKRIRKATLLEDKVNLKLRKVTSIEKAVKQAAKKAAKNVEANPFA